MLGSAAGMDARLKFQKLQWLYSELCKQYFLITINLIQFSKLISNHRKPKTKRGKRFLENRAPKVVENTKQALFVKGGRTNEIITRSLKEFVNITALLI